MALVFSGGGLAEDGELRGKGGGGSRSGGGGERVAGQRARMVVVAAVAVWYAKLTWERNRHTILYSTLLTTICVRILVCLFSHTMSAYWYVCFRTLLHTTLLTAVCVRILRAVGC